MPPRPAKPDRGSSRRDRPRRTPERLSPPTRWNIGPVGTSDHPMFRRTTGLIGNTGYAKRAAVRLASGQSPPNGPSFPRPRPVPASSWTKTAIAPVAVHDDCADPVPGRTDGTWVSLWRHRWNIGVVPERLAGPGRAAPGVGAGVDGAAQQAGAVGPRGRRGPGRGWRIRSGAARQQGGDHGRDLFGGGVAADDAQHRAGVCHYGPFGENFAM